jgi:hypothetical protein
MRPSCRAFLFLTSTQLKEICMKHEFSNEAPMLRLAFAVAAVSVTLSIGGFIDCLAVGYAVVADAQHRPALTAEVPSRCLACPA